ncbi:DMT family transporter [Salipiger sp. IMCC34102]|uniref:DMT family transporter n=1 Tax=Salipiger sp. IMCC34102 TaxID=2510647 RepID=UPI00101CF205|nr:DMT family transporter [Salipiger sp. IMCC34102]RYH01844.1 DMT family transporter [Salipiger sp. IMCC34102]
MSERARLTGFLVLLGLGWGLTTPLNKITVSLGRAEIALVFWQMLIGAVLLGIVQLMRRRRLRLTRATLGVWVFIALMGTILPNSASFRAAAQLPAGIMAIAIASVPMFAFPMALALGTDRFTWLRALGLGLGLTGVALIALPQSSLPDPAMAPWLLVALVAPFCYAIEGNAVARWGTGSLDAVDVLFGASLLGALGTGTLAAATGAMFVPRPPFVLADASLLATSAIHAGVYCGYVWLVGRAGATFAGQVAYLVTGFGVAWSMILLGERYSLWVWTALAAMLAGLSLVKPRDPDPPPNPIAPNAVARHDGAS